MPHYSFTGSNTNTATAADTTGWTWNTWAMDATTHASATIVWSNWATGTTTGVTTGTIWIHWITDNGYSIGPVSDEEYREREQKRKEAEEKAEKILAENLDEEQRKDLAEKGEFEVESQSGRRYAVARGRAGNVFSLDEQRRKVAKYCIHPEIDCPDEDTILAQVLWLKWNEIEFLHIANMTKLAA